LPCDNATQTAWVPARGKLQGAVKAANERSNVVKAQKQWAQSNSNDIGRAKIDNETIANEFLGQHFGPVVKQCNVPSAISTIAGRT